MNIKLNSIYIGATDMPRAVAFYQEFLGQAPISMTDRFSKFSISGISFCLYDASKDGNEMMFGNNCVPDFQVDNADECYRRIKGLGGSPLGGIQTIDGLKIFQFRDCEGNIIEIFE